MPVVIIDAMDVGPQELGAMLPLRAELIRVLPGPDRPDYCLAQTEHRILYRPDPKSFDESRVDAEFLRHDPAGSPVVLVYCVVIAARFAGTQVSPDMKDLWVNLAYVIDNSVHRDDRMDLAKLDYVAVVRINLDPSAEHLFGKAAQQGAAQARPDHPESQQ